jgi:hypothetical protein
MKIVAFLQNMWFKEPERMKQQLATTFKGDREKFIRTWLFWSCLTGKRLRSCFGEELCDQIIWEEQSPQIGGFASSKFPADIDHIVSVLDNHKPEIVVGLGREANKGIELAKAYLMGRDWHVPTWTYITGPHPAARGSLVIPNLRETATSIRAAINLRQESQAA